MGFLSILKLESRICHTLYFMLFSIITYLYPLPPAKHLMIYASTGGSGETGVGNPSLCCQPEWLSTRLQTCRFPIEINLRGLTIDA